MYELLESMWVGGWVGGLVGVPDAIPFLQALCPREKMFRFLFGYVEHIRPESRLGCVDVVGESIGRGGWVGGWVDEKKMV